MSGPTTRSPNLTPRVVAVESNSAVIQAGGVAKAFVGLHDYLADQLITQGGQLWTRNAPGTSRATFDATEQALWTSRGSAGGSFQNVGADLPTRSKANVFGGARATDTGTVTNISVVDEALFLPHVALDNGLTLTSDGTNTPTTRADNTAIMLAALARAAASTATRKRIMCPGGGIALNPLRSVTVSGQIEGPSDDRSATVLSFQGGLDATALGGDCAIDLRDSTTGLRNITIAGGASLPTMGINPPEQYGTGIRLGHGWVENVKVTGFCYPLDARLDHVRIRGVDCPDGWCAVLFGANSANAGDGKIERLIGGASQWCGVAISPSYLANGVTFDNCHFISNPFGIWKMGSARRFANYTAGTIAVANGDLVVHGSGTTWKTSVKDGSALAGVSGGAIAYVSHVIDDTTLTLTRPWTGSTVTAATYRLQDGAAYNPAVLSACAFFETSFEGVNCKIASEDNDGSVVSTDFYSCKPSWWPTTRAEADPLALEYHVRGLVFMQDTSWRGGASFFNGVPSIAAIQCAQLLNVDFGEQSGAIEALRAAGKPFIKTIGAGNLAASNVTGTYYGADCRWGRSRSPVLPYDLLMDGGYSVANAPRGAGNEVKPYATAKVDPIAAALSLGIGAQDGVPWLPLGLSGVRVNIAPTCVVSADAAIGATTLVTFFTSRLGPAATAVTLQDSAGVVRATGTVTNATDIAVTALGAAITTGTQLWVGVTAGTTIAASTRAKARFSAARSAATDQGLVIAAGSDWSDAPVVGSTAPGQADTGRTAVLLPVAGVLAPVAAFPATLDGGTP